MIDFELNNGNKPVMFVPVGASGTGKTTYLKALKQAFPELDIQHYSWDLLRHEWYNKDDYADAFKKSTEDKQFGSRVREVFRDLIRQKKSVYVDNTNLTRKSRAQFLKQARQAGYHVVAIDMPADVEELVARQETRGDKKVPEEAVRNQFSRIQPPTTNEFDEVFVSNHNFQNR